jgi:hypothetical protein
MADGLNPVEACWRSSTVGQVLHLYRFDEGADFFPEWEEEHNVV